MINRQSLLSDLQSLLKRLEADLLERSESAEISEVGQKLRAEYERAKRANRTAQNYEDWRGDAITQAAAAWVLSCVFVRFLEDNRLIEPPRISGQSSVVSRQSEETDNRQLVTDNFLQRARDEHEIYFREHPTETDREYLLAVFDQLATLPGTRDVFGEHNPLRELPNWLSGDAAGDLLRFFQKIDANTGALVHDFCDPEWDTRFLGDLYQDLSEAARKKYALLQTPEFVEEFILDRTLDPAIEEFGLEGFRMIDPACGSGHFLLGAFRRIENRWETKAPNAKCREVVQWTLDSIFGVDVNPFAVAIARFRLLLAALRTCGVMKLANAPAFHINLACGDSLLQAPLRGGQRVFDFELVRDPETNDQGPMTNDNSRECDHAYQSEDLPVLKRMLRGGQYHAVMANPPYVVPRDKQLNELYRRRFASCYRQYSLAVPFMEMLFRLGVQGSRFRVQEDPGPETCHRTPETSGTAGFVGQITANSFMKREFGKKLIESFLPTVDLTHVIDTSGAYIPGHGTPTVILFGRNRAPVAGMIRTVMGIRGEPSTPDDPSRGLVWTAIVEQLDQPGSQSDFVSVGDSSRELFHKHPWSIGGGGAAELKEILHAAAVNTLEHVVDLIGFVCMTRADDVYFAKSVDFLRHRISKENIVINVEGDRVRDWTISDPNATLFPYGSELRPVSEDLNCPVIRFLWPHRTHLWLRREPNGNHREIGLTWYEWSRFQRERFRTPLSIVYGEVATHNHFVLDRGGKVFKQTAPVIKLPPEASEDDHLALLGLLNSSTACFWMKQVCFPKGGDHVGQEGARVRRSLWDERYAFNATNLQQFPILANRPLEPTRRLDELARQLLATTPAAILMQRREDARQDEQEDLCALAPLREALSAAHELNERICDKMICLQEELDWQCYRLYGVVSDQLSVVSQKTENCQLTTDNPPPLELGQRAFEIALARKIAAGETQTTWFERHDSTPITELPAEWPDDYRQLVERRIALIESDPNIRLIEQPEYKRRWNTEPWDSQQERALRHWLLNRLESYFDFDGRMVIGHLSLVIWSEDANDQGPMTNDQPPLADIALVSIARLADVARQDPQFMEVGEVYRDDPAFDVQRLVEELVAGEHVPMLPVLRYKPSGLRKRREWEKTWELQREEDVISHSSLVISNVISHSSLVISKKDGRPTTNDQGLMTNDQPPMTNDQGPMTIPVPPKYTSSDFISTGGARYWALRGKLDVPKERWVSFPYCEGPDGTMVVAWAGYDHLQLARAISAYFVDIQERQGGRDDPRLVPLLASIIELLPWLKQWHHDLDVEHNQRMDEVFDGFVTEEAKNLGMTIDEIKAWQPPQRVGRRRRSTKS